MRTREELIRNYDRLAPEYAERFCHERDGKAHRVCRQKA